MRIKNIKLLVFLCYVVIILWMTLLSRNPLPTHRIEMRFMWTYRDMIAGNPNWEPLVIQNIENILFFIPFGFFSPIRRLKYCLISGIILSIIIEMIQYFAYLGLSELDDVVCNGFGTMIGFLLHKIIVNIVNHRKKDIN